MTRLCIAPALLLLLGACHTPGVSTVTDHPSGGSGGAPAAPPPLDPPTPITGGPDGGAAPPSMGGTEGPPTCAEDRKTAQQTPVDLMLLVDRSSSMAGAKWNMSTAALSSFVSDPRSVGLGLGLQFFPLAQVADVPCKSDADCGIVTFGAPMACLERRACIGPGGGTGLPPSCGRPGDAPCGAGTTCVPLGRCSNDAVYCNNLGAACPGLAGTCKALGNTCAMSDFSERCTSDIYNQVSVDFGDLPAAQMALTGALKGTTPEGGTPMVAAVEGTLAYMRVRQTSHPERKSFLILATDGVPSFCEAIMGSPVDAVVKAVTAAHAQPAPITTYTIGVFDPMEGPEGPAAVNRIAAAGGTGTAFVLSPTSDLNQKLLAALDQIRGAALPCEFAIPPARNGGTIDFGKVNLHFHGAKGDQDVLYVGAAARCDAAKGGWYYDVDPMTATPTTVKVCDATCGGFKADGTASVSLGFGCKTRVIE